MQVGFGCEESILGAELDIENESSGDFQICHPQCKLNSLTFTFLLHKYSQISIN